MFNAEQFRSVVTKVLNDVDPALSSPDAVEMLLLTAAHETALGTYLYQVRGPAKGVFQMEPDTFEYLRQKFLGKYWDILDEAKAEHMTWDLRLAALMARLHYRIISKPLPNRFDVKAMAAYAKRYWNTPAGKATEADYLNAYNDRVVKRSK